MTTSESVAETAERLFETGEDEALLRFAESQWPEASDSVGLTKELAEMSRFASIVAVRVQDFAKMDLWQARARCAAMMAGGQHTMALLLQSNYFSLTSSGDFDASLLVLNEMRRMVDEDDDGPPSSRLLHRIVSERTGFSYLKLGRFSEAESSYSEATKHVSDGARAQLKVRGGLTLSVWLGGGDHSEAAVTFDLISAEAAESSWKDVEQAARSNCEAARAERRDLWVPFELV